MRKQTIREIDVTYWDIKCDLCGTSEITPIPQQSFKRCEICRRDMCNECRRSDYGGGSDDYPRLLCEDCWNTGEEFRKLIDIEEERHGDAIDDIYKRWDIKAREYVKDLEKKNV